MSSPNKNLPNIITLSRIALIPFFMALFMLRGCGAAFEYAAAAVFLLASVTDFLDGFIARRYNLVSDMGKFLDPIADKLLVAAALFLILGYAVIPPVLAVVFVTVIIAREFMVSALRQIAVTKRVVIAADKWGKAKTVCQLAALTVLLLASPLDNAAGTNSVLSYLGFEAGVFNLIGTALLALAVVLTIVSGVNYIVKNKRVFADDKGNGN